MHNLFYCIVYNFNSFFFDAVFFRLNNFPILWLLQATSSLENGSKNIENYNKKKLFFPRFLLFSYYEATHHWHYVMEIFIAFFLVFLTSFLLFPICFYIFFSILTHCFFCDGKFVFLEAGRGLFFVLLLDVRDIRGIFL